MTTALLDPHHRDMGPYEDGPDFDETLTQEQYKDVAAIARIEMDLRDACEALTGDEEKELFQAFENIKQDRFQSIFNDSYSSEIDAFYEDVYRGERKKILRSAVSFADALSPKQRSK